MKKSKTPYVALYPADFLADIGHLGNAELGIYWRLILVYYRDFRPLPFDVDRLRRLAMAFSPEDQRALDEVIAQFFVLGTDDGAKCWRHNRCDKEIGEALHRHQSAVDRGKHGAEVRWKDRPIAEPLAEPSPSQWQSYSNQNHNQNQNQKNLKTKVETDVSTLSSSVEDDGGLAVAVDKKTAYRLPDCPYQALVDAYHELLPAAPRVEVLSEQRKRHLQARWRQVCADEKLDRAAGLQWFRDFFEHANKSAFLTGKVKPSEGRKPFFASLDWLMSAEKFIHVYEGRYHR